MHTVCIFDILMKTAEKNVPFLFVVIASVWSAVCVYRLAKIIKLKWTNFHLFIL